MATTAFKFKDYTESDAVKKARENVNKYNTYTEGQSVTDALAKKNNYETNNNPGEWQGGNYQDAVKSAWDAINNRAKFSYDLNGDALYQQYKDKYINQGRLAMADTIGQASAMTGGYGNSYAVTAGSQAYQSHLQNLNDIVPQLYQMAYDKYNQEGQDLKDKYSLASDMYNREYGEHRDKVADYNTELARLTDAYNAERSFDYGKWDADRTYYADAYNAERNFDYGKFNTEQTNAFNAYQQGVNEEIQRANLAISQRQLELQELASEAEENFGLNREQINDLEGYYVDENWEAIDRYLASLNINDKDLAALQQRWLPEDYGALPDIETPIIPEWKMPITSPKWTDPIITPKKNSVK